MSFVDYRDVAEVAALALAGDDLVDGTFELAAGGMLTRTEIAAMISRHAGRTVLAEDVDPDVALGGMPAGAMRDGLTAMFADYTAYRLSRREQPRAAHRPRARPPHLGQLPRRTRRIRPDHLAESCGCSRLRRVSRRRETQCRVSG